MRRHYLDNIRWITVGLVVLYHVIFMYNSVVTAGVIGPFWEIEYQDAVQYLLYPWFMVLLFLVSGMCARYYLEGHSDWEFLAGRTRKLLVPSTIGLFVFWWIQGYFNMAFSHVFDQSWEKVPKAGRVSDHGLIRSRDLVVHPGAMGIVGIAGAASQNRKRPVVCVW